MNIGRSKIARACAVACCAGAVAPAAMAFDFKLGDLDGKVGGNMSVGTGYRISERNAEILNTTNAAAIGATGLAAGGRNSDDGNLNFGKGERYSTVAKGVFDLQLKSANVGAFARILAWRDFTLTDTSRRWGNLPNGLSSTQPLSDAGADRYGKFDGIELGDAYLFGNFSLAETPASFKLGKQTIGWGRTPLVGGGLNEINPSNTMAARRPGALPSETVLPVPAVSVEIEVHKQLKLSGFYQFGFQSSVAAVCGTMFALGDFAQGGCDKILLGAGTDQTLLASGSFIRKVDPGLPADGNQFGVSAIYDLPEIRTVLGLYAAQYHSRGLLFDVFKTRRTGVTQTVANDPLNPTFRIAYPEKIRMLGAEFRTALTKATGIYGEIAYRPNQPVRLSLSDLLGAFTGTTTTPGLLNADRAAVAPGGLYPGYDRKGVWNINLGFTHKFVKALGSADLDLTAELAGKHVAGLPDASVRRYGRPDVFGLGPVPGTACTGNVKRCTFDGYVTRSAAGVRLRASTTFRNLGLEFAPELALTPSVAFGHDLEGYSYDGALSEGRQSVTLSLRAAYREWSGTVALSKSGGGLYDVAKDRDFLTLSLGYTF
ncbi:MAG: DUF1302 family protein [Burkholderiales bacterium]